MSEESRSGGGGICRCCCDGGGEEEDQGLVLLRQLECILESDPLMKLVISRNQSFSYLDELQLSTLILSYSPKSECSWSHRRWLIKQIAGRCRDLLEIIGKESELVKKIAEKSKMNYRAWNHRCWLVSYMTRRQVLDELNESRKWAELHIADNCCFHYRRRLMLRLLEDKFVDQEIDAGMNYKSELYLMWEEELGWNQMLIECYIGREALWVHRRFLSQFWSKHFANNQHAILSRLGNHQHGDLEVAPFLSKELNLLHSCLNVTDDEFEDARVHREHATAYFLWILKQIPPCQENNKLQEKVREMGDLKATLRKFCSQKGLPWEGLSAGSMWENLFG